MITPWDRLMLFVRQYEDHLRGTFRPNAHDVRQVLQEHTQMLGALIMLSHSENIHDVEKAIIDALIKQIKGEK